MGRIGAFLLGLVVGAVSLYFSMQYHFVHAHDGWHPIPKTNARLSDTIVDIRKFGPNDWIDHPGLALAITNAKKTDLMLHSAGNAVVAPLQSTIDSAMEKLELPSP